MDKYIETTQEAGRKFYMDYKGKGKVVMLNLLKFKQWADYSSYETLKPAEKISGKEAYKLYMHSIQSVFESAGSRVLFFGKSHDFMIGPASVKWDAVLLAEHESAERFIEFAQNEEYLKHYGHRQAALEDSRLLPSSEIKGNF